MRNLEKVHEPQKMKMKTKLSTFLTIKFSLRICLLNFKCHPFYTGKHGNSSSLSSGRYTYYPFAYKANGFNVNAVPLSALIIKPNTEFNSKNY